MPRPSAWAKLQWTRQRMVELDAALAEFDRTNPDPVSVELDPEGPTYVYRSRQPPALPAELPLRIGEILFGLRAALDHAVYAISSKRDLEFHSAFPIFLYPTPDWQGTGNTFGFDPDGLRKIRLLPTDAQAVVKRHQPFDHNPHPTFHPLWRLQELRNIDEHRALILAVAVVRAGSVEVRGMGSGEDLGEGVEFTGLGFHDGDVVLRLPHRPNAQFEPRFSTEVLLDEPGPWRHIPVVRILEGIRDKVTAAVTDLQQFV